MPYNPHIHNRQSLRLKGYDYSKKGAYFITICCQNRIHRFGSIENEEMILNEYGEIAHHEWIKLADRFKTFRLDVFQIMPNHMHAILILKGDAASAAASEDDVRSTLAVDPNDEEEGEGRPQGIAPTEIAPTGNNITIGDMIGAYKSLVANKCLDIYKSKNERMGKLWQRNYYEIIIRNELSYQRIRNYIIDNPRKWHEDRFNWK